MAEDKKKKELKGVTGNYNQQAVKQKKYYYTYGEVDDLNKGFADSFTDITAFNSKLKNELEKDTSVKLVVHQEEEDDVNESCGGKKKKKKKTKK